MTNDTEITQSEARLPDAIILKKDVYFDRHIVASPFTIMQQESGNSNMCTFYIFVVLYYL